MTSATPSASPAAASAASADLPAVRRGDFPADFRWGCATASYQIEGAAREDGRGESIWDRFSHTPGKVRNGDTGDVACDHYHRWPQDLDLLQSLGANAYRFSIAWPRIQPTGRGAALQAGLDFYSRLVDGLLERGLQPWVTLYHWDLPQALQDEGGWMARDSVARFADYADIVTRALGDRVKHWITHNEPFCTAFLGHQQGVHAPGVKDLGLALQVHHHLLLSHGRALPVIRANVPGAQAGITLSLHPISPASDSPADLAAAHRHDGGRNRLFLDPLFGRGYPADVIARLGPLAPRVVAGDLDEIARPCDFLGINYYFPEVVADATHDAGHDALKDPLATRVVEVHGVERTAFGWPVVPEGLTTLLTRVTRDYAPPPIYITENGSTFDDVVQADGSVDDAQRLSYLIRHLAAARDALAAGVPLKGYFAWSLLDNFEWAEGYLRRFGITYVDFQTQQRTLKASGQWYAQFCHDTLPARPPAA